MKVLIDLLLMTATCYASNHVYDQLCSKENKGFLRHPDDCHKFIRCSHQRAYEFQCPSSLLWHHEIKSCDFSYRTQCKLNRQRNENNDIRYFKDIAAKKKEDTNNKSKKKYEEISTHNSSSRYAFANDSLKISKKLKRDTDIKQNCLSAKKENVKGSGNTTHAVKDASESISEVTFVKLIEPLKKDTHQHNAILWDNFIKRLSKESNLKNPLKSFSSKENVLFSNQKLNQLQDASTTTSLNIVNALNNSFKNRFTKMNQEEGNINVSAVKPMEKQNSTLQKTAGGSSVHLKETILTESFTLNSKVLDKEINSVNFTELKDNSLTLAGTTEPSVSTLSSTDNSFLKIPEEGYAVNIFMTEASAKAYNENKIREFLNVTNYVTGSFKSTETMVTAYFAVNSAEILNSSILHKETNSVNLTLENIKMLTESSISNLDLTDTPTAEVAKSIENFTKNYSTIATDFDIPAENNHVNSTEITLLNYNIEAAELNLNNSAQDTQYINLQASTDSMGLYYDFTVDVNVSLSLKDPTYLPQPIENLKDINSNKTEISSQPRDKDGNENLTGTPLTKYTTENFVSNFYSTKQEENRSDNNLTENLILQPTSSEITKGIRNSSNLTDHSTYRANEKITLITTDVDSKMSITVSSENKSVKLTETMERIKSNATVSNKTAEEDIENFQNNFTLKSTDHEHNNTLELATNTSLIDHFTTTSSLSEQFSVTTPKSLKETITEASMTHSANITESSKINSTMKPFFPKNDQAETTISAIQPSLQINFSHDTVTQDPRLPFRSVECQGVNNRRQLKALKCYQYYQCFDGWAFLLNCREGLRFQAGDEQCILDINKECNSE